MEGAMRVISDIIFIDNIVRVYIDSYIVDYQVYETTYRVRIHNIIPVLFVVIPVLFYDGSFPNRNPFSSHRISTLYSREWCTSR